MCRGPFQPLDVDTVYTIYSAYPNTEYTLIFCFSCSGFSFADSLFTFGMISPYFTLHWSRNHSSLRGVNSHHWWLLYLPYFKSVVEVASTVVGVGKDEDGACW